MADNTVSFVLELAGVAPFFHADGGLLRLCPSRCMHAVSLVPPAARRKCADLWLRRAALALCLVDHAEQGVGAVDMAPAEPSPVRHLRGLALVVDTPAARDCFA